MSEDNLARILAHPHGMVCSDGGAFAVDGPSRRGHPHPRGLGTFPRVLGRYVRERKALTLEQAINKMTALPASRVHLARPRPPRAAHGGGRRRLRPGDRASTRRRTRIRSSIRSGSTSVIVNGAIALRDGQRGTAHTGCRAAPELISGADHAEKYVHPASCARCTA